jgi:hypothetical protein
VPIRPVPIPATLIYPAQKLPCSARLPKVSKGRKPGANVFQKLLNEAVIEAVTQVGEIREVKKYDNDGNEIVIVHTPRRRGVAAHAPTRSDPLRANSADPSRASSAVETRSLDPSANATDSCR